jgi:CheY-like chemotaxis protein
VILRSGSARCEPSAAFPRRSSLRKLGFTEPILVESSSGYGIRHCATSRASPTRSVCRLPSCFANRFVAIRARLGECAASGGAGREAVQEFRTHRPDITPMDLQMPDMNGVEAIIAIRWAARFVWS